MSGWWTTHERLLQDGYRNACKQEEPCVLGVGTEPSFAIGQRALLIQTGEGNILWDCVTVLDGGTLARIRELGGIRAIAISHPHFYSRMADWAEEFDATIYVHEADRQWVMQPSSRILYWTGERLELFGGAKLLRLGGHFPGSAVLHWAPGADGSGILCTEEVERIRAAVEGWDLSFEVLYGGWFGRAVHEDAKAAVLSSADRYVGLLRGTLKRHWNS